MKSRWTALGAALVVSACGGGGGDAGSTFTNPPTPPAAASAEGIWLGAGFAALVTASGETWAVDTSNPAAYGELKGVTSISGTNAFSTSGTAYVGNTSAPASAAGTVSTQSALSGTFTGLAAAPKAFAGTYSAAYGAAPSLAGLAGNYVVSAGGTVTVGATGTVSGSIAGCTFTGTVIADPSGRNIYRPTLLLGAAPCAQPHGTMTGVLYPASGTTLIAALVGGSLGTAVSLSRP